MNVLLLTILAATAIVMFIDLTHFLIQKFDRKQ